MLKIVAIAGVFIILSVVVYGTIIVPMYRYFSRKDKSITAELDEIDSERLQ